MGLFALAETIAMWTEDNFSDTGNDGTHSISCCAVGLVQGSVTEFKDVTVSSQPPVSVDFEADSFSFNCFWGCHAVLMRTYLDHACRRLWH